MQARRYLVGVLLLPALLNPALAQEQEDEPTFTEQFPLESCRFSSSGGNAFFMLKPGRQLYLSNSRCLGEGGCEELEEVWITVTPQMRKLQLPLAGGTKTVWTRMVEERETADGELVEVSRNYFADCWPTHDVYYFGEEVDDYEDGEIVGHDGAWLAGEHGAMPGIIMPDQAFLLGSRYYQEVAPGVAQDRAEHAALGLEVTVPAGVFENCVQIVETTPLDPDEESTKIYCPGVGLVVDDDLELIAVFEPRHHEDPEWDGDND